MAKSFIQKLFGTKQEKDLKQLSPIVKLVNAQADWARSIEDADFPKITAQLKKRLAEGETLEDLLPQAFALAREAADRVLHERHYDEQIMGAIVLHQGRILEMKTGEGKTLTCVPAAYLNALEEKGVHIITVNDYLAQRDTEWMGPIYKFLGLTVGSIISDMDNEARRQAYACDITYGTNNEFGFDYLRDNMKWDAQEKIQPLHHYCIIDEIDSILIDEARTPLIISGQAADDTLKIRASDTIVPYLVPCQRDPETQEYPDDATGDFQIDEKQKKVIFTNEGLSHIEELLQKHRIISGSLYEGENFEFVHYMTQAVKAHQLFHADVDYIVAEKKVQIVDEFTGRVLHGRRYSDGLHQAIEAKEKIRVEVQNKTLATITFQNFFRMYDKISGMTGTADTEAPEFLKIYNLDVVVIPTHLPIIRKDLQDLVYLTEQYKYDAICQEIEEVHAKGQPILVGTVSIESSELLSTLLQRRGIKHEVLNAKNHAREAAIIENAGAKGAVTIATNMAGRGTDIKLGGSLEAKVWAACGVDASPEEFALAKKKVYPKWKEAYEEVKSLGGLYILGTERHESRRIDNQLRGRSGRQGDPGVSRFFLSLDDTLMRLFAKDSIRNMLGRIGMGAEPIEHTMVSRAIEKAQMRVEEQNFEIRKHLLEYDDVLNEQRNYLYNQRDNILKATDLLDRGLDACKDIIHEIVTNIDHDQRNVEKSIVALQEGLEERFHFAPPLLAQKIQGLNPEQIEELIFEAFKEHVNEKIAITGAKPFNDFLRFQYLRQIDMRWQDHLDQLEALREAVYLRSYAQKNPLLEYKLEGFDIFDSMINEIRAYIAVLMVRVKIQASDTPQQRRPSRTVELHGGANQFAAHSAPDRTLGAQPGQASVQIRRTTPKVGRNEPCPCGSGKKYKHCHGRNA
ncbi:MAG: preprotein translocase subunit SecA [Sphaerochaetaceae bacterium]|jgi:preprotein translocase subunit SecA|nr:preprotein translocase subunit SecA [Sphaerochaetaceae bacterium]MDY0370963.1 preprotein translocase subunit SecA [Sphaerochaetaceae bacterium]